MQSFSGYILEVYPPEFIARGHPINALEALTLVYYFACSLHPAGLPAGCQYREPSIADSANIRIWERPHPLCLCQGHLAVCGTPLLLGAEITLTDALSRAKFDNTAQHGTVPMKAIYMKTASSSTVEEFAVL